MKLSIIVPCYNESRNIPLLLERFNSVVMRDDIEVIIVNNGSQDNTDEVLAELMPRFSFARAVKIEENKGYGHGILTGLKEARGQYLGWTHADLQTDPGDCLKALDIIEREDSPKDIYIKGNRKARPLADVIFTIGMGIFESIYLGTILWDINAQPNIFHREFFMKWKNPPSDFSLDLYALYTAKKTNKQIVRFPVLFLKRKFGTSSWNADMLSKIKFIKRTLAYSLVLRKELKKWNA